MQKLSEIKGEYALDVLAEILDPATEIIADEEVHKLYEKGKRVLAVSTAIKKHKKAVIHILAVLDGEDPETYKPSLLAIPIKAMEIFNDPDLIQVFSLQAQNVDESSSGSATVNTEEAVTK